MRQSWLYAVCIDLDRKRVYHGPIDPPLEKGGERSFKSLVKPIK